ncbi:MAG TPA: hypothetical protein VKZ93_05340, partial [Arenibacter sp.]|nr:hypothetical protein [Arenibacter sp.]
GTVALILVTGGIFLHNLEFVHHWFIGLPAILSELIVGLIVGFACLMVVLLIKKVWRLSIK